MTTSEQLQSNELLAAINRLEDASFKEHMLGAIESYRETSANTSQLPSSNQEEDAKDAIVSTIKNASITLKQPRDVLVVAIHLLMLEAGFVCNNSSITIGLPDNWDSQSAIGLFQIGYRDNVTSDSSYQLQGLFVGGKLELYITDSKSRVRSIEISGEEYIRDSQNTVPLRNIGLLRAKISTFLKSIMPVKKVDKPSYQERIPPYSMNRPGRSRGDPVFPSVGAGDVFPSTLLGEDSGMLVGPGHALFGRRPDPTRGPIPGARFDPFGPIDDPTETTGRFRNPFHPPAPNVPFGTPNPDHLRMPRDDDSFPLYPAGPSRPFGSDHAYFESES